eukprot:scaffold85158_cov42-Phaeocystis_antarctica.AAC.1
MDDAVLKLVDVYSPMRPQLCAKLVVVAASSPDWRLLALLMYGRCAHCLSRTTLRSSRVSAGQHCRP